ncbi:MAG: zinc ABC transporter substrate-binding protein [Tannerella sp.]|nr:zinc ABC transporter substrate-binding protein [Tannerella sp.]
MTGCGVKNKAPEADDRKEITVTIDPLRYFAEQIAGDHYTFFSMLPVGQSPETYTPSPREMIRAGKGTACFHLGQLGFEQMLVHSIHENNADMRPFDLSEGMIFHEGSCHAHDHNGHDHDPHIWTSFEGAKVISGNILKALTVLDKENQACYQSNYNRLIQRLDSLEEALHDRLDNLSCRSFVIYHPALTYFAEEFGLIQHSIEKDGKEPSPALLKNLIEEARDEKIGVVFVQMEFDRKHADQIARAIGAQTIVINPLDYQWDKQMEVIVKALLENGKAD